MFGRKRQQPPAAPATITAGATRIDLANPRKARRQAARPQEWQGEAWAYAHEVPEIGYALDFIGNAFSKLRIFAGVRPEGAPADSDPVPVDSDDSDVDEAVAASAVAEIARLSTGMSGLAGLLRKYAMNIEVPGELYLVGMAARADQPEEWTIRSTSEIHVTEGGAYHLFERAGDRPTDTNRLGPGDDAIRMWQEDPEWTGQAYSPMKRLRGECRTLQVLSQLVLAQAMRACSAGFITIANELNFGPANPTTPEDGAAPPADPLSEVLADTLLGPIEDPSDPASVSLTIIRGQHEYLHPDFLRVIRPYDSQMDETLDKRIEQRVRRLARGINLPVEVVEGHMNTTFRNAEQIDEDTFEDHLQPRCELMVRLFTYGFLTPNLRATFGDHPDVDRIVVWFDASDLIAQPDTEKHAGDAHEAGVISDAARRKYHGFTEDDAPDEDEMARRRAGSAEQAAVEAVTRLLLPRGEPERQAIEASATPVPSRTATAGRNPGWDLMDMDRDLRTRLIVASNDAMTRALERAGNRMRSGAVNHRAILRNVAAINVGATLGRTAGLAAADDPLKDAWDDLESSFVAWATATGSGALLLAQQIVGLSDADVAVYGGRLGDEIRTAWAWMRDALNQVAMARMFDPNPTLPDVGELDADLRVPPALVRQAMARAGGATGLVSNGNGGAWVALADAGNRPAGGIATGDMIMRLLADMGVAAEGYTWVYGPAYRSRPFKPHMDLSGKPFTNFDDPVLYNPTGWPGAYCLPGDHQGCSCDCAPLLVAPAGQAAA